MEPHQQRREASGRSCSSRVPGGEYSMPGRHNASNVSHMTSKGECSSQLSQSSYIRSLLASTKDPVSPRVQRHFMSAIQGCRVSSSPPSLMSCSHPCALVTLLAVAQRGEHCVEVLQDSACGGVHPAPECCLDICR